MQHSQPHPWSGKWSEILLLAIAYLLLGLLARQLGDGAYLYATSVWPPAGLALGVLLARGASRWPGVWLGAFLVNAASLQEAQTAAAVAIPGALIATGATLQALLAVGLTRRFFGRALALDTPSTVLRFLFWCGPMASLVSPTMGSATLYFIAERSLEASAINWLYWWSGDTMGVFLVTPAVLALLGAPVQVWRQRRLAVAAPLVLASIIVAVAFSVVARLEHSNRQAEFSHDAVLLLHSVRETLGRMEETPALLASLYLSGQQVTEAGVQRMAESLMARRPEVGRMEWMRLEPQGSGASAGRAAAGHPEPDALPADVVARLAAGSEAVAGSRVDGGRAFPGETLVTLYFPVRAPEYERLEGITSAAVRVGFLMNGVLGTSAPGGLSLRLEDLGASADEATLFQSGVIGPQPLYTHAGVFAFGGRPWRLVLTAGDDYLFAHRAWYAWLLLAGTVGISALLSLFLLVMSGRSLRTEQLVAERTAELEAARRSAEKSNQLLREAVSSIAQGFTIYDEQDRLVICNETYRQIYHQSADLIVPGSTFESIVRTGAERGQYREAIGRVDAWVAERVAQHQKADGQVLEQRLGNGRWLLIVEHRTPSGFIVGNRIDITNLKLATAALEDRNAQLDAIFRLSPDGLVLFDPDGLVKYANPAFLDMAGMAADEIVGRPQEELEQRLRERAEEAAKWAGLEGGFVEANVGAGGTANRGHQHLLTLKRPRACVLDLVGVESEASSVGRLLYVRDVTHEVEVDRMKSEFLSHAAHELRTPMASIYGFSELLITQEFDAETRKDLLETIHKQTEWLIEIINELLDLSRIESRRGKDLRIEPVPLGPLVAEVLSAQQIDRVRWPVILHLPDDLPPVKADVAKMRQVLTNVVGNAVKYSPEGGEIEIAAAVRGGDAAQVGVTVRDHGIGMTPAQAARVCERFYRADTSGSIPGTGLGMAIVREVIELLGGRVDIESATGAGTAVTVWLPAAQVAEPSPQGESLGKRGT